MKTFGKVFDKPKKVVEIVEAEPIAEKPIVAVELAEQADPSSMTRDEIMAELKERGIEFSARASKAELIALLV